MKCNIKGCQSYDESHDNNCNNKLVYMYLNKACYRLKEEERIKMTPPPPPRHPKPEKKQQYFRFNDEHKNLIKISIIKHISIAENTQNDNNKCYILISGIRNNLVYYNQEVRDKDYEKLSNILTGLTE